MNRDIHHRANYLLIDKGWNPVELDEFLKRQYRQGLFGFALSLATVLYDSPSWGGWNLWSLRNVGIPYYKKCAKEISSLQKIRAKFESNVDELNAHLLGLEYWKDVEGRKRDMFPQFFLKREVSELPVDKKLIVRTIYKLDETFKLMDEEIEYYASLITPFKRKKGRPAERVYILSALWSLILKDTKYVHWNNIENLLNWFRRRLGKTCASKIRTMPSPELIRRYKNTHSMIFSDEIRFFFAMRDTLPSIQIKFDGREPKFYGFSSSKCKKCIPHIVFLAGVKFYG